MSDPTDLVDEENMAAIDLTMDATGNHSDVGLPNNPKTPPPLDDTTLIIPRPHFMMETSEKSELKKVRKVKLNKSKPPDKASANDDAELKEGNAEDYDDMSGWETTGYTSLGSADSSLPRRYCPFCDKSWPSRTVRDSFHKAVRHITEEHSEQKVNFQQCPHCQAYMMLRTTLKYHLVSHHNDFSLGINDPKKSTCRFCDKDYENNEVRDQHMNDAHSFEVDLALKLRKLFKCGACSAMFLKLIHLRAHIAREHPFGLPEEKNTRSCPYCDYVAPTSERPTRTLTRHIVTKHPEKRDGKWFSCHLCSTVVRFRGSLRRHLVRTHKVPPDRPDLLFTCRYCDATFLSLKLRRQHIAEKHAAEVEHDVDQKNLYRCEKCGLTFNNRERITVHLHQVHNSTLLEQQKGTHRCKHCGKEFVSTLSLQAHIRNDHKELRTCPHCNKVFLLTYYLNKHLRVMHTGIPKVKKPPVQIPCQQCDKTFCKKRNLERHILVVHSQPDAPLLIGHVTNEDETVAYKPGYMQVEGQWVKLPYKCKLCPEAFRAKKERLNHYKVDHPTERPITCKVCDRGFYKNSSLANHMQSHNTTLEWTCEHCSKQFKRKDTYREHLLIHSGIRHKCAYCPKEFVQKSNLTRHTRIHTGEKPYSCDYCGKRFSDKGACNEHIRVHTGASVCFCTFCGKKFSKKQKLNYHLRVHTGVGLEYCTECDKGFPSSYHLRTHINTVHKKTPHLHPCSLCGANFPSKHTRDTHKRTQHPDSAPYKCTLCEKAFFRNFEFKQHFISHSRIKPFHCQLCEKSYYDKKGLTKHLLTQHQVRYTPAELPSKFFYVIQVNNGDGEFPEVSENSKEDVSQDQMWQCNSYEAIEEKVAEDVQPLKLVLKRVQQPEIKTEPADYEEYGYVDNAMDNVVQTMEEEDHEHDRENWESMMEEETVEENQEQSNNQEKWESMMEKETVENHEESSNQERGDGMIEKETLEEEQVEKYQESNNQEKWEDMMEEETVEDEKSQESKIS